MSLLSTPLKIKILDTFRQAKTINELISSIGVSRNTIKPHVKYLSDHYLIKKVKNCYILTEIGEVLLNKVIELESLMELLERYGSFFVTHDLYSLPEDLVEDIYMLKDCTICTKKDPFEIRYDWAEIARESNWLKCVTSIFYPELLRMFPSLAEGKEEVKVILTSDVLERAKAFNLDLTKKCMSMGEFYLRDSVNTCFWVSDRQLTLFLSEEGKLDLLNVLICNDENGIKWGSRLFDFYLQDSVRIYE